MGVFKAIHLEIHSFFSVIYAFETVRFLGAHVFEERLRNFGKSYDPRMEPRTYVKKKNLKQIRVKRVALDFYLNVFFDTSVCRVFNFNNNSYWKR